MIKDNSDGESDVYFSESGQDKFINNLVRKNGFVPKILLEAGAFDPFHLSNSRHFINKGWKAILVEPNPKHYKSLKAEYKKNPKVAVVPKLLSDSNYKSFLDPGKDSYTALWSEGRKGIPVEASSVGRILKGAKVKKIGILFLDTEGTEPKILKKMVADKIYPEIICVENHTKDKRLQKILNGGYKKVSHLGFDDIFVKTSLKKFDKREK